MIDPIVCPYCGRYDTVRFKTAWTEEDTFIEEYHCDNCDKEYYVDYDITNPHYRKK